MKAQAAKKEEKMAAFQWSMIWNDPSANNNGSSSMGGGPGNVFWDDPMKPTATVKANARQQNGVSKSATEPRPFETNIVNSKQKPVRFQSSNYVVIFTTL